MTEIQVEIEDLQLGYLRKPSGLIFPSTEHQATSADLTEREEKNLLTAHRSATTSRTSVFSYLNFLTCKL